MMVETSGTLELKIARLQHRLAVLEEHQRMSRPYPAYQARLAREIFRLRQELAWLTSRRNHPEIATCPLAA
ncbi:MAG: hypothetical protein D6784_02760 [Chloroflexi bacterium]|nr:MAG: hypothetical protein D6784_02760 [Chloroflexota bacterium]